MTRTTLHILLGVLLWVVFGYYWWLVAHRPVTPHTRFALVAVGTLVAGISLFLVYWVFHNIRIAKRRQRRRARVQGGTAPATDFLGRTFLARSEDELQRAPYVEVHVVETTDDEGTREQKVFRIADRVPGSP